MYNSTLVNVMDTCLLFQEARASGVPHALTLSGSGLEVPVSASLLRLCQGPLAALYLVAKLDAGNQYTEFSETNNVASRAVYLDCNGEARIWIMDIIYNNINTV